MAYEIDSYTRNLIKQREGFGENAYVDASGHSIGYGHFIKKGEEHLHGKRISKDDAENLLSRDIAEHQAAWIDRAREAGMNQVQIANLTSFTYNTGRSGTAQRVITAWKRGDKSEVARLIGQITHSFNPKTGQKEFNPELASRRSKEISGIIGGDANLNSAPGVLEAAMGQVKDFISSSGAKIGRGAHQAWNKFHPDVTNMLAAKGGTSATINLNECNRLYAEWSQLAARASTKGWDDTNFLETLRREGANTWQAS